MFFEFIIPIFNQTLLQAYFFVEPISAYRHVLLKIENKCMVTGDISHAKADFSSLILIFAYFN